MDELSDIIYPLLKEQNELFNKMKEITDKMNLEERKQLLQKTKAKLAKEQLIYAKAGATGAYYD